MKPKVSTREPERMYPKFAVVGHPNKGKSSIVATLSQDDQVEISSRSGTTTHATAHRVEAGDVFYDLIDTPGFQRPTKALHWLDSHCGKASDRPQTVKRFIADAECIAAYPDEVALLTPIVDGAAVLYVVDGSRPFGSEYEAEMEILRWTGQPSMALINPIESSEYIQEWENALSQYFKSVRVFNPMVADFEKQMELLQTFAYWNPQWKNALTGLTSALIERRERQNKLSALILARLLQDVCGYQQSQKVLSKPQAETVKSMLAEQYHIWMKKREQLAFDELLANYAHTQTPLHVEQLNMPPDLFDVDQWYAWGLEKKQLLLAAGAAGAVSGAAIDLALAGHSLMLGAAGGGLLGLGAAFFGAEKLVSLKVKGLPMGGYTSSYGPVKNRNFPYVIIGRFLYCHQQVSALTHANRAQLQAGGYELQNVIDLMEKSDQKELHKVCARLAQQKPVEGLEQVLQPLFGKLHDND